MKNPKRYANFTPTPKEWQVLKDLKNSQDIIVRYRSFSTYAKFPEKQHSLDQHTNIGGKKC